MAIAYDTSAADDTSPISNTNYTAPFTQVQHDSILISRTKETRSEQKQKPTAPMREQTRAGSMPRLSARAACVAFEEDTVTSKGRRFRKLECGARSNSTIDRPCV